MPSFLAIANHPSGIFPPDFLRLVYRQIRTRRFHAISSESAMKARQFRVAFQPGEKTAVTARIRTHSAIRRRPALQQETTNSITKLGTMEYGHAIAF